MQERQLRDELLSCGFSEDAVARMLATHRRIVNCGGLAYHVANNIIKAERKQRNIVIDFPIEDLKESTE